MVERSVPTKKQIITIAVLGLIAMGLGYWVGMPKDKKEPDFLKQGLVAYYPFNGNAKDESGNGNDGEVNSATLAKDRNGQADSAYSFDGVDDYIQVPNSPNLNSPNVTISTWYKATISFRGNGHNPIIQKPFTSHIAPYYQWSIYIQGDQLAGGQFWLGFHSQSGFTPSKPFIPEKILNHWVHLVGVVDHDRKEYLFFFDGRQVSRTLFASNKSGTYETDIYVGCLGNVVDARSRTPGVIDDICIYNRALREAEVKALYEFEKPKTQQASTPTPTKVVLSNLSQQPHYRPHC